MFYESFVNNKWLKYKSEKKIEINYAEKQNNKSYTYNSTDENTYFYYSESNEYPTIDIPIRFLSLFKSHHPDAKITKKGEYFQVNY